MKMKLQSILLPFLLLIFFTWKDTCFAAERDPSEGGTKKHGLGTKTKFSKRLFSYVFDDKIQGSTRFAGLFDEEGRGYTPWAATARDEAMPSTSAEEPVVRPKNPSLNDTQREGGGGLRGEGREREMKGKGEEKKEERERKERKMKEAKERERKREREKEKERERKRKEEREKKQMINRRHISLKGFRNLGKYESAFTMFHNIVKENPIFQLQMEEKPCILGTVSKLTEQRVKPFISYFNNILSTLHYFLSLEVPYVDEQTKKIMQTEYCELNSLFWSFENTTLVETADSLLDSMNWKGRIPKKTILSENMHSRFRHIMEQMKYHVISLNKEINKYKEAYYYYKHSVEYNSLSAFDHCSFERRHEMLIQLMSDMDIIQRTVMDTTTQSEPVIRSSYDFLKARNRTMQFLDLLQSEIDKYSEDIKKHLDKAGMNGNELTLYLIKNLESYFESRHRGIIAKLKLEIEEKKSKSKSKSEPGFEEELISLFETEQKKISYVFGSSLKKFELLSGEQNIWELIKERKDGESMSLHLHNAIKWYLHVLGLKQIQENACTILCLLENKIEKTSKEVYEGTRPPTISEGLTITRKPSHVGSSLDSGVKMITPTITRQDYKKIYSEYQSIAKNVDKLLIMHHAESELTKLLNIWDKMHRIMRELHFHLGTADMLRYNITQLSVSIINKKKYMDLIKKLTLALWHAKEAVRRGSKLLIYSV